MNEEQDASIKTAVKGLTADFQSEIMEMEAAPLAPAAQDQCSLSAFSTLQRLSLTHTHTRRLVSS